MGTGIDFPLCPSVSPQGGINQNSNRQNEELQHGHRYRLSSVSFRLPTRRWRKKTFRPRPPAEED